MANKNRNQGKYLSIILVFVSGIILSFFFFYFVYRWEENKIKNQFSILAHDRTDIIHDTIESNLSALKYIGDFYASSQKVDRDEFHTFVQGILLRQPSIFEFRWIERVPDAERQRFEEAARQQGFSGFQIKELDKEGIFIRAAQRDEYFPVTYIEFSASHSFDHRSIFGLDAASFPERWQAMQKARDTAQLAATGEISYVGETGYEVSTASRIFLPVYRNNLPHNSIKERRDNLIGFVTLLYQIDKMVETSFKNLEPAGIDIYLYDETKDGEKQLLYFYPPQTRKGALSQVGDIKNKAPYLWTGVLKVADHNWNVVCRSAPAFLAKNKIFSPWFVLLTGVILTFILTFYLFGLLSRTARIEALVQERTEEIRQVKERYEGLVHNISVGIYRNTPGPEGHFLEVNPAIMKIFAADSKEDFLKIKVSDLYQNPEARRKLSEEIMEKGFVKSKELELRTLKGKPFWASVTAVMKKDKDGNIYFDGVIEDITVRKEAEEKIKRLAVEWEKTFNAISDFMFIQDKDFTILKVNKALAEALKKPPSDIIGKKCYEVLHGRDKPWPNCPFEQTKEEQIVHVEEVDDANLGLPLLVTTLPIFDDNGKLSGSVHIAKDISEIKKAREDLEKKNKELERLDQLKSDFVSTVSHELRTPLAIVKEGVSQVLDKVTGAINESQERALRMVYSNINRLSHLIADLLDISKIEAGRIQLKKSLVDVTSLVKDIVERWRLESEKKHQQLEILVPDRLVNIYLDIEKIEQVLNNLISNAIKYTNENGTIKIVLRDKGEEIEIIVSDNGIGIAEEDQPHVFEKFRQFSRSIGDGTKGTGLGLAITKDLIQLHEGRIALESKFDQGSKFTVTLPKFDSEAVFKQHIHSGIQEAEENNLNLSLVVIKISDFIQLQQELGVERVHLLLKDIEEVIDSTLRRKSDTVVRDTGELIVILLEVDKEKAALVTNRITEIIQRYLNEMKNKPEKEITFKIGFATYPEEAKTEDGLLDKARGIVRVNVEVK